HPPAPAAPTLPLHDALPIWSATIKWASTGTGEVRITSSTTTGPMEMLGTKWPSITSTCTMSALEIDSNSVPKDAKLAAKIEGLIRIVTALSLCLLFQKREEHGVRAVLMWPQLRGGSGTKIFSRGRFNRYLR